MNRYLSNQKLTLTILEILHEILLSDLVFLLKVLLETNLVQENLVALSSVAKLGTQTVTYGAKMHGKFYLFSYNDCESAFRFFKEYDLRCSGEPACVAANSNCSRMLCCK
jgi:hypothetical protein